VDRPLAQLGVKRRVVLSLPFFVPAIFAIAQTDLILTVPRKSRHEENAIRVFTRVISDFGAGACQDASTVPSANPKMFAVSRIVRPSNSRNWKVFGKMGDRYLIRRAACCRNSVLRYSIAGFGRRAGNRSEKAYLSAL